MGRPHLGGGVGGVRVRVKVRIRVKVRVRVRSEVRVRGGGCELGRGEALCGPPFLFPILPNPQIAPLPKL